MKMIWRIGVAMMSGYEDGELLGVRFLISCPGFELLDSPKVSFGPILTMLFLLDLGIHRLHPDFVGHL